MKNRIEKFIETAKAAGYAAAEERISGCVVLTMPKGLSDAKAAALYNGTTQMLADAGLQGSLRCLPSDEGRAVVAQSLRAAPEGGQPEGGTPESGTPKAGKPKGGKPKGK